MPVLDTTHIAHGLWQGAAPSPKDPGLKDFRVLILCAREYQPDPRWFPENLTVVHAPNDDSCDRFPTDREFELADRASDIAVNAIVNGEPVLVTCMMGLNRSGLVSALTLVKGGYQPEEALKLIQSRRQGALRNPYFARLIQNLKIVTG